MVKVTFEGNNVSELKESIKEFFAGTGSDDNGGGEPSGDEPKKTRNRSPKKDPEPEKVTHATIRKWVTENEDKKADVRELLADHGYDSISDIPEEKLEKIHSKIQSL